MVSKRSIFLFVVGVLVIALFTIGCGDQVVEEKLASPSEPAEQAEPVSPPKPEPVKQHEPTIAQKLATVHEGVAVDSDSPEAQEFAMYLFLIEKKVVQNEAEIADILVKAWELIDKNKTLLEVFQEIDVMIPDLEERDLLEEATEYVKGNR